MSIVAQEGLEGATRSRLWNSSAIGSMNGLAIWGFANILVPMLIGMAPGRSWINANALKYFIFSITLNLFFTLIKARIPLRIPAAIASLILLNFWLVVCIFHASWTRGTAAQFGGITDYWILLYFLWFLQASILNFYMPKTRELFLKCMVTAASIHGFFALLQFANFGPALQLASYYNATDITNWGGQEGTRVVGLTGWPLQMTQWAIYGATILMSHLLYRKHKPWETLVTFGFIFLGVMAQMRTLYPVLFVLTMILFGLLIKRNREGAFGYISFMGLGFLGIGFLTYQKLQYGFSSDTGSLQFRLESGWPQAFQVLKDRPFFGIGPEPRYIANVSTLMDRYYNGYPLDNGYLDIGAWGGYPAMALFIAMGIFAIRALVKQMKVKGLPIIRRRMTFILLFQVGAVMFATLTSPTVFDLYTVYTLFVLGGFVMSSEPEYVLERGRMAY